MERKIGEIFDYGDIKLIIKEVSMSVGCSGCYLGNISKCVEIAGLCTKLSRSDNKAIIASKLSDFERSKIQTINSLWEKYVENEVELIFKDKNDVTGVDKSAMKASLKLKMDDFMFKFIKQIAQNEDI